MKPTYRDETEAAFAVAAALREENGLLRAEVQELRALLAGATVGPGGASGRLVAADEDAEPRPRVKRWVQVTSIGVALSLGLPLATTMRAPLPETRRSPPRASALTGEGGTFAAKSSAPEGATGAASDGAERAAGR